MKREVTRLDADQLNARYPIDGGVPGWRFRLDEVSAGVYEAEAVDELGHRAFRSGTDPDRVLGVCVTDAQALAEQLS
jgi:hypothetical protein